jgi:DNA-directed RNA polymerase subunit M/transcription elongation factor TFIIS
MNDSEKQEIINRLMFGLAQQVSNNELKIDIYKCPECKKFVAFPKVVLEALKTIKKKFNNGLCCPFCEHDSLYEIKRTKSNEEHYEAHENGLSHFEAKPLICLCHECFSSFTVFMHNKDFLNRCPICGEEFKIGNYDIFTLNKKLDKDITYNDVLDEAEEQQFDEDEYPLSIKDDFENNEVGNYLPLSEYLIGTVVYYKLQGTRKETLAIFMGYNPSLKMVLFGLLKNKTSEVVKYVWVRLDLIVYMCVCGDNPRS